MNKTAIIIGATGLVGKSLLHTLLNNEAYAEVLILVRNPFNWQHPKLKIKLVDFTNEAQLKQHLVGNDLFICTGTTMKKAGSKTAFEAVDYHLPLLASKVAAENGVEKLLLISASGADENSMIYYSKVKGQLETELRKLNFKAIYFFRPSLLLGNRAEQRIGEAIAQLLMKALGFLFLVGPLRNFAAIEAEKVAKSMMQKAAEDKTGVLVVTNAQML
jgi:uncharacterized protein YbjT (DUF2867 family)